MIRETPRERIERCRHEDMEGMKKALATARADGRREDAARIARIIAIWTTVERRERADA